MSLTYTSPEAMQKAQTARRNAALSTLLLTLLVCAGVFVALAFVVIKALQSAEPVITPLPIPEAKKQVVEQEIVTDPQPDPPSSSAAPAPPIVRLNTPTDIPMQESTLPTTSISFSATEGTGGLGLDGFGSGPGGLGGGFEGIFDSGPVNGNHFAFCVDFSGSNSSSQKQAIQKELIKTINGLNGVNYQVIGFAGPAWFLGDEVTYRGMGQPITVNGAQGRNYSFTWDHVTNFSWKPSSGTPNEGVPRAQWLNDSSKNKTLDKLDGILAKKNWIGGTNWAIPLETALQMSPQPDVIYFLTDGRHVKANELSEREVSEKYGNLLKSKGIDLISIALVSDLAKNSLIDMTSRARGKLFLAKADGTGELVYDFSKMSNREIEELQQGRRRNR